MVERQKGQLRRYETMGKPVVAAINGAAMGGGLEIALACHYRIAIDSPKVSVGLPEVTLGLMPGCGGVVRLVRLLGLEKSLPILTEGKPIKAAHAHALGIIDELASDQEDMLTRFEGPPGHRQVGRRGSGHDNRVNRRIGEQVVQFRITRTAES